MSEQTQDTAAADAEAKAAADAAAATAAADAAAGSADTPKVPESYALTFADGTLLDRDAATARITERAKALKVTDPAFAQAFVDVAHAEVASVAETLSKSFAPGGAAHAKLVDQWTADSLAAPDLGNGDPVVLERKTMQAGLVLNRYAPKAAQYLRDTGGLVHPEMLRLLNAVFEATQEKGSPDPALTPGAPTGGYAGLFPDGVPAFTGKESALSATT